MADSPILAIPISVDDSPLDALLEKLAQARESLKDIPMAWGGTGTPDQHPNFVGPPRPSRDTGSAGRVPNPDKGAQSAPKSEFDKFSKASTSSKLSGSSSFIERFRKSSFESEKSWKAINRELEKSFKSMAGLARMSVGLNPLGILGMLGAAGSVAGAAGGAAVAAANNLAGQNLTQRQLNLRPGEEQSFDFNYAKVGGDSGTLRAANTAKLDPQEAQKLQALGIGMDQVQNLGTADLAALMLEKGGQKSNEMGNQAGMYWKQFGLDQLVPMDSAQAAGSYLKQDPDAFTKFHNQEQADIPKFAQQQADQDRATEAKRQLDEALAEASAALDRAFIKLTPEVVLLADKSAAWLDTFSKSGELDKDITLMEDAFKGVAGVFEAAKAELNKLFGLDDKPKPGETHPFELYSTPAGSFMANLIQGAKNIYGAATGAPMSAWETGPGKAIDWGYGGNGGSGGSSGTSDGSPFSKLMDAIKMNESSGINGQTNKQSGAAGLYGISIDNARAMGIDPMDPVASRKAAEQIFGEKYAHFHDFAKAAAAYDGDTHIDADSKKYDGDWLKGAKQETIDYLKKLENQGQGLDLTPAQQAEIDRLTTVKKEIDSPNTAPNAEGNGAGYDFSMPKPVNSQQAPIAIGVNVSAPAGSNTNVSIAGISQ